MLLDILEAIELNIVSGIKVGKVIDNETKQALLDVVSKKISEVAYLQSKEDIYIRLKKIKKIKKMTLLNRTNTWIIKGTYNLISKNICLAENVISDVKAGKIDRTIIHEFIHALQNARISFKGKSIKGIIEGVTESYTDKILKKQKSQIIKGTTRCARANYPPITSYVENVSIVNQLDIVLGENLIEELSLRGRTKALEEIIKQYGIDFYEKIRKGLNKRLKLKNIDDKIALQQELQTTILTVCYGKKYEEIKTIKDAIQYFKELKRLELEQFKIKGDTTFRDFYKQKYDELMKRFSSQKIYTEELEILQYVEAKFNSI